MSSSSSPSWSRAANISSLSLRSFLVSRRAVDSAGCGIARSPVATCRSPAVALAGGFGPYRASSRRARVVSAPLRLSASSSTPGLAGCDMSSMSWTKNGDDAGRRSSSSTLIISFSSVSSFERISRPAASSAVDSLPSLSVSSSSMMALSSSAVVGVPPRRKPPRTCRGLFGTMAGKRSGPRSFFRRYSARPERFMGAWGFAAGRFEPVRSASIGRSFASSLSSSEPFLSASSWAKRASAKRFQASSRGLPSEAMWILTTSGRASER